jgi:hypothetical protein
MVAYTGKEPYVLRYVCHRSALDNGEPPCITFAGLGLDEAISHEVMAVLEPAAIDAAALAAEQETVQQEEIISVLKRELEAARYSARRAEKQYEATDPDNRLVASELERRWNSALEKVQQLEMRIEQAMRGRQGMPTTKAEFESLAGDLEAVWKHPETDVRLKKRIVRTLNRRGCCGCGWSGRRDHCRSPLERRGAYGDAHSPPATRLQPSSHRARDRGRSASACAHLLG